MTTNTAPIDRSRPASPLAIEVRRLLSVYPHLSPTELRQLIDVFPKLPILDFGLMTADDQLAPKLEAFQAAHGRALRTPISSILAVLSVPAIVALVVILSTLAF